MSAPASQRDRRLIDVAPRGSTEPEPPSADEYEAEARIAAQCVDGNRERILALWEQRVRLERPSLRSQDHLALRDSLPEILESLATTLYAPERRPPRALDAGDERLAEDHGEQRAGIAVYSLEQVIAEYHVLERVVVQFLEECGVRDRVWRNTVSNVLFLSMKTAAAAFQAARDRDTRTRRFALEEALGEKASEGRLKDLLLRTIKERLTDYAMLSLDPPGRVTSWARGAQRMMHYEAEEILGHHFSILYPEDGRRRQEPEEHLRVAREAGRFRGEGLRMRRSGEVFLADVFIVPMVEDEEVVGYFEVVSDLTERNRVVQERDLSRAKIETLQLESELRERFVSTLTHDLRNPLGVALMGAQLTLREGCSVPFHGEMAKRSLRNLQRIDRMVTDLLDASRIRAGEPIPLGVEACDLARILDDVRDELSALAGDRVVMEAPSCLPGYWDRQGLHRVLTNLVVNGLKYGEPKTAVTTRARRVEDRVLIEVHNFGRPIPTDEQESLFTVFRRSESVDKARTQGWGLGLTIVRGITMAHGGVVKVLSLPTAGTTFTLDLPLDARNATPT